MAIIRDIGLTLTSLDERHFVTCSTAALANGVLGSSVNSTANVFQSSNGAVGVAGRIIDRLNDLFTKDVPLVAMPATVLYSSRGSTEADRKLTLGVSLQHGDSSGGGDMAAYSTAAQPDDRVYFTSARTTDFANWQSTGDFGGPFYGFSNPAYYDLRAAKRYIRALHYAVKNRVTTESSGDEGARVSGYVTFLGGNTPKPAMTVVSSTSTST